MDLKEFAKLIDGRENAYNMFGDVRNTAKESGFVIVYGASDDLMEIDGAIQDEADVYSGGEVVLARNGVFNGPDCDCGKMECPYFREAVSKAKKIKAVWCGNGKAPWSYETEIPHESFRIYEDGELFCEGIVFSAEELA